MPSRSFTGDSSIDGEASRCGRAAGFTAVSTSSHHQMPKVSVTAPAYTIADLIDSYSNLLHYVREDAKVHLVAEYDEDDELCATKLYDRRQAIDDDGRLWNRLKAATDLIESAKLVLARWERGDLAEAVRSLGAAIAKAEGRG